MHRHLLRCAFEASAQEELTLDQDATFIETKTSGALYNYQGKRSYEALNVYCPEYDLVVASRRRSSWPWWRNGSTEGGEGSPFSYLGGHRPVGPGGSYRCGERYNNLKYRPFFSL